MINETSNLLRVVILSTPSKHHTYFVNKLARICDVVGVIYKRRKLVRPYPTGPFFEAEQDEFEEKFFDLNFGGTKQHIPETITKYEFNNINQPEVIELIRNLSPDIGIAYGIGKAEPSIFTLPRFGTINVHRGIAEYYRGLDSDLWAIHEGQWDKIGVTIHVMDERLDTGAILAQEYMSIDLGDEIFHIRYKTGIVATRLVGDILREISRSEQLPIGRKQLSAGPYYSAMSLSEKINSQERFKCYMKSFVSPGP